MANTRRLLPLAIAVLALTACGGGEDTASASVVKEVATKADSAPFDEEVATKADSVPLDGEVATKADSGATTKYLASSDLGGIPTAGELTADSGEGGSAYGGGGGVVAADGNPTSPVNHHWHSWVGSKNQASNEVTAASAMGKGAWNSAAYRYQVKAPKGFTFVKFNNADDAVASCKLDRSACVNGTITLLKSIDLEIKQKLASKTCNGGPALSMQYGNMKASGRNLLATSPSVTRIVAFSATGFALYTGVTWFAYLADRHDVTKISQAAKQYSIWLIGMWLTAYIGTDVKAFSAEGLIQIQNAAIRARGVAIGAIPLAVQGWVASGCPSPYTFWTTNAASTGDGIQLSEVVVVPNNLPAVP